MNKLFTLLSSITILITLSVICPFAQCPPTLSPVSSSPYCQGDLIRLSATPAGGTLSGPGAWTDFFGNYYVDTQLSGAGNHTLTYTIPADGNYLFQRGISFSETFSSSSGTNIKATKPADSQGVWDDVIFGAFPIGFTFNFYGNNYTEFRLSSNGFITFSNLSDGNVGAWQNYLPNAEAPDNIIAFAWSNLVIDAQSIVNYSTVGSAPNRTLVINFGNVRSVLPTTTPAERISVQIQLVETSNKIRIVNIKNLPETGRYMTMGIENSDGSRVLSPAGLNNATNTTYAFINETVEFSPLAPCVNNTATISLQINPKPAQPTLNSNRTTLCRGENATITANCTSGQVKWNTGATGNSITVSEEGIYTAWCENNGCISDVPQGIDIKKVPVPQVSTSSVLIFPNFTPVITAQGCPYTIQWSNGQTGKEITVSSAGSYRAVCNIGGNCPGDSSNKVTILSGTGQQIAITGPLCLANNPLLTAPFYPVIWQRGDSAYNNYTSYTLSPLPTDGGKYNAAIPQYNSNGGWFYYNRRPELYAVFFKDNLNGWTAGAKGTIMKTTDGGVTWLHRKSGTPRNLNGIFFISSSIGWAVGEGGTLLYSTNGGNDWDQQFSDAFSNTNLNNLYFLNELTGWIVGTNGLVAKTVDGGSTWTVQKTKWGETLLKVHFIDENFGWASGDYLGGQALIYSTTDGGTTWVEVKLAPNTTIKDVHFLDEINGWATTQSGDIYRTFSGGSGWIKMASLRAETYRLQMLDYNVGYLSTMYGVYKTTNGGVDWILTSGLPQRFYFGLSFLTADAGWAVASDGTIRSTSNGGNSWNIQLAESFASPILTTIDFNGVHFTDKLNGWLIVSTRRTSPTSYRNEAVFKTSNAGVSWTELSSVYSLANTVTDIHFSSTATGWITGRTSAQLPVILKTTNGGTSWSKSYELNINNGLFNKVFFANQYTGWAVGTNGLISKTVDAGTWSNQNSSVTYTLNGIHFVNTSSGWVVGNSGTVLRTVDGGQNWVFRGGQTTTNLKSVHFVNSQLGWVAGEGGTLMRSVNGGLNWTIISIPWSSVNASLLSPDFINIYFSNPQTGWLTSSQGVILQTDDGGSTWRTSYDAGQPVSDVSFVDGGKGWVAGRNSTLLSYQAKETGRYITNSINLSAPAASITISAIPSTRVCANTPVTLSVSGCSGLVTWTNNGLSIGTGSSITITAAVTTNYTATCSTDACSGTSSNTYLLSVGPPVNIVKIWDKTFGGSGEDYPTSIGTLADGNFFVSGYFTSPKRTAYPPIQEGANDGTFDRWIVKFNSSGILTKEKTLSGYKNDPLSRTITTPDGGLLMAGWSNSDLGGSKGQNSQNASDDLWLLKIDSTFTGQWSTTIGGNSADQVQDMIALPDGGYLIGGNSRSPNDGTTDEGQRLYGKSSPNYGAGYWDYWLVKVDQFGKKVWDKSYGGSNDDLLLDILETSDGNYLLIGVSASLRNTSGNKYADNISKKDYWVVKVDKEGNRLWDKNFGGLEDDEAIGGIEAENGNYIIYGYSNSPVVSPYKTQGTNGGNDIWLLEIRPNGDLIKEVNIGGTGNDVPKKMIKTNDGNYVLGARSNSGTYANNKTEQSKGGIDGWIISFDKNLNKLWDKTYGGGANDYINDLILLTTNELLVASESNSPDGGDKNALQLGVNDFWIQKYWIPTPPKIFAGNSTICNGQQATLEASACPGSVYWSNGLTGNSIKVSPSVTTSYTATCSHQGQTSCSSETIAVTVCQSGSQSTFGYTAGSYTTTDGGGAVYSFPIVMPSGSAGVKPELGLVYNSQGGNGLLGVGWSLDGLQVINRSSKTRAQDEAFDVTRNSAIGISLTKEDRYSLNGSRLVLTPGHIQQSEVLNANYGRKGTEYYTEQNQFVRVSIPDTLSNGAPQYFLAHTKDGLILEFGNSANSRVDSKEGIPITYLVTKITDRNGNYISYFYDKQMEGTRNVSYPYGKVNAYPVRIEYTANGNSGAAFSAYNKIEFDYIPRSDKQWNFIKGSYIGGGDKLLSKIRVSAKNGQGNFVEVRRYEMTYIRSKFTGNSLFYQVRECADTLCHEPTMFNWNNEDKSANDLTYKEYDTSEGPFQVDADQQNPNKPLPKVRLFGDWDGDGTSDLCIVDTTGATGIFTFYLNRYPHYKSNGQSYSQNYTLKNYQFRTVDFNVDGKSDILFWNKTTGDAKIIFAGYSGNDNLLFSLKANSEFIPANTENGSGLHVQFFQNKEIEITDWNHDGITDLVSIQKSGRYYTKGSDIWLQTQPPTYIGNNSIGETIMKRTTGLVIPNNFNTQSFNRVQITDFNNDGLSDVCLLDTASAFISIYKLLSVKTADKVFDSDSSKYRIQDPTYTVQFDSSPVRFNWSILQNKFIPFTGDSVKFYNRPFFATDVNGDGLPDIGVKLSEYVYQFQISTGDFSFFEEVHTLKTPQLPTGGEVTVDFADINNDGSIDLLTYNKAGAQGSSVSLGNFDRPTINVSNPLDVSLLNNLGVSFFFGNYSQSNLNELLFYKVDGGNLTSRVYTNTLSKSDLIGSINEGSGQEIQITYKTLKDASVYTRVGNSFRYPLFEFTAPISVVASVRSKDGIGGYVYTDYQYEGAFSHSAGRGFRGFTKVISKDRQRNTFNIKYFSMDTHKWWLGGYAYKTELRKDDPVNGQILSQYEATFEAIPYTIPASFTVQASYLKSRSYYTYGKVSVAKTFDLNTTNLIGITTSRVIQDAYGNAIKVVVDHGDGVKDSTLSQYTDNIGSWLLGRLTRSTAYRFSPGKSTSIRTVSFEYNSVTGQLIKEISDPDSSVQIKRETVFTHDAAGNIIQTEVKAWNGTQLESQITQFQFDNQKRLKQSIINPLGHQSFVSYNIATASVATSTDINGLVTTFQHDAFQRINKVISATGEERVEKFYRAGSTWNSPVQAKFVIYKKVGNAPAMIEHYDILGRMIRMDKINFSGNTVQYIVTFNNKGEKISETGPGVNTAYQYDLMSRVIRMTGYGSDDSYEYIGNQTTVTDIKGRKRIVEKNNQGQLLNSSWHSSNGTITNHHLNYEYDGRNNLTRVVGNDSFDVKNFYDARGYKIRTVDPVMGTYRYEYNGFGEMIKQIDPKGNVVTVEYDKLGRLTKRIEPEGTTTYVYDIGNKAKGKVTSITGFGSVVYGYAYDNFGRLATETKTINSINYTTSYQYTPDNKIDRIIYPSGLIVKQEYNAQDYLHIVRRVSDGKVLWRAKTANAADNLLTEDIFEKGTGQNAVLRHSYSYSGDLSHQTQSQTYLPTDTGTPRIQQGLSYDNRYFITNVSETIYSNVGQLMRTGSISYTYDDLDQLTAITPAINFPQAGQSDNSAVTMRYDLFGNIKEKSDVGKYHYDKNALEGPRYLTRVDVVNSAVCIPSFKISTDYTSFNKVKKIANDSSYAVITYGPDHARIMQQLFVNNKLTKTKVFVNSLYEVEIAAGQTKETSYIRGGSGVIATETKTGTVRTIRLWVKDYSNNLVAVVDTNGNILEHLRYDVWGRRLNADKPGAMAENTAHQSDRGFTKHEHLDLFQLIDMNGRVYDPVIARFISPDPFVQDALDLQAYNRYAYVQNNPIMYIDPSGYIKLKKLISPAVRIINKVVDVVTKPIAQVAQYALYTQLKTAYLEVRLVTKILDSKVMPTIVRDKWREVVIPAASIAAGVAAGIFTGGNPQAVGAAQGFTSGFVGSAANGGSYKDAVTAGTRGAVYGVISGTLSAGVTGATSGIENQLLQSGTKAIGQAAVQGTMTEAQGGEFWKGAAAGAVSSAGGDLTGAVGPSGQSFEAITTRATMAAVLGGTVSVVGGGKFANGAMSGAFSQLGSSYLQIRQQSLIDRQIEALSTFNPINNGTVVAENVPPGLDFFEQKYWDLLDAADRNPLINYSPPIKYWIKEQKQKLQQSSTENQNKG